MTDLSMRQARLVVSPELLREVLCLPEGTEIFVVGGINDDKGALLRAELYVRHPDLPALAEGEAIPTASPTYEMIERPQTVRFLYWNLPT